MSNHLTNPFRRGHKTGPPNTDPTQQPSPGEEEFAPPPGPPPGHAKASASSKVFQPPPGPPPSANQSSHPPPPPAYADWMSVPDTSQLPPPPAIVYDQSPTANASSGSSDEASRWCRINPLNPPRRLPSADIQRLAHYDINLTNPPTSFSGKSQRSALGTWHVQTRNSCQDTILLTDLPLYSALDDNVRATGKPKTVYFEIKVAAIGQANASAHAEADSGVAVGFVAPPYPHWRLPGWERASLGVHGDDGRKYVHNNMGGQDFTTAFKDGQVVGIGMTFTPGGSGQRAAAAAAAVNVFFTREGELAGGWDLHEERDSDGQGGVEGLEGDRDLFGAIGMFGRVEFETRFRRDQWLYRPQR